MPRVKTDPELRPVTPEELGAALDTAHREHFGEGWPGEWPPPRGVLEDALIEIIADRAAEWAAWKLRTEGILPNRVTIGSDPPANPCEARRTDVDR